MLPDTSDSLQDFEVVEQPSLTFKLNWEKNRINGMTDGLEAVKQAVYLILNIERYQYLIYNWSYGIELQDLIGKEKSFVLPELEKRITEALIQDSRITAVSNFSFETKRKSVIAFFEVETIYGNLEIEKEVRI